MTALDPSSGTTDRLPESTAGASADPTFYPNGRAVAGSHGWKWIRDGFVYFRRQAGMWIVLTLIFFGLIAATNLVPGVGWLVSALLIPVFVAGLMTGCRTIELGGELELSHLFAGFRHQTGQLLLVGLIGFGLTVLAVMPLALFGALSLSPMNDGLPASSNLSGYTLAWVISVALFVPINMALWFASALVILRKLNAVRAVNVSFRGCLKNIVPFVVYGVILFVLAVLASIPLGLGWLVLGPVALCSVYTAYRDIFSRSAHVGTGEASESIMHDR
jgi:hypothetical protein